MTTAETRQIIVTYNRANFSTGKMEQNVTVTMPYVRGAKAIESALCEFIGADESDMVQVVNSEIVKPRIIDGEKLASYYVDYFATREDAEAAKADDETIVESLLFSYSGAAWIFDGDYHTDIIEWSTPAFLTIGRANKSLESHAKSAHINEQVLAVTECTRFIDHAPHMFFTVPNKYADMIYKADKNAD